MTSLIRLELPLGQLGRLTGQTETLPPSDGQRSHAGRALDVPQAAAEIGDPVPIVFCRYRAGDPVGQRGGVTIAPPATDGNFSNDSAGAVTARYQLLLSEGRLGDVEVRDVFQAGNRVGAFTQAYGRRAGNWGPGISMRAWGSNPAPAAPQFVGTGQGLCDDVTMGAFSITRPAGDESWRDEIQLFIRNGMELDRLMEEDRGPSDNLADLVVWALLRSGRVSAQLVDGAAMLAAAEFLNATALRFNGVMRERAGLLDWLTEVLPYYLLRLVRARGIYRLRPLLPTLTGGDLNLGKIEWSRTFTVADIDVSSLRLRTLPSGDRRPMALLLQWRQQLEGPEAYVRTTAVRYGGSALSGPFEQVDLSAHATSAAHVVIYGAFRLARRRYVEHRLTFRLKPSADSEAMAEGDIVRVILTATNEDVGDVRIDQLYSVEQISRSPAGVATLELLHFPVDDQGRSLVALDVAAAQALDVSMVGGGGATDAGHGGGTRDENSSSDTTVPPDPGPWPQWQPPAPPEPLYPVGDDLNWPSDVEIPDFPPIGVDPLPPISDLNPNPVPPTPIPPPGDGWGPGRIPAPDIGDLSIAEGYVAAAQALDVSMVGGGGATDAGFGGGTRDENSSTDTTVPLDPGPWPQWQPPAPPEPLYPVGDDLNWPSDVEIPDFPPIGVDPLPPISDLNPNPVPPTPIPPPGDGWGPGRIPAPDIGDLSIDEGYVAAVSFDQVRLTYPDVFYSINQLNAVGLAARVTVDNPPVGRALRLVIGNGLSDEAWAVTIPAGETAALLPPDASTRTDTLVDDAERSLQLLGYSGGGYYAPKPAEGEPKADPVTATPSAFTVRSYVGTISFQSPGIWQRDGSSWTWAGTASLGDWEWVVASQRWAWNGSSTDWEWVPADQRWGYIGAAPTGWEWLLNHQRWRRTAAETDPNARPDGPPSRVPSPPPSSPPPGAGFYTVVAQAAVNPVPIGGPADDLVLAVTDFEEGSPVEPVGDLTIPAVWMRFGAWRWNPATTSWEHMGTPSGWRWSAAEATWVYLLDAGDWTWNQATEEWADGTGPPPGLPPLQNSSTHPPDAERWIYDTVTRQWSGSAQILGGTAPVFDGLLSGSLTYHRLIP